jgi:hypothetical protein
MSIRRFAVAAFLAMACAGGNAAAAGQDAQCAPQDTNAVVETMREMYAALAADDEARLTKIFAPGFYAFDGGKRFDAPGLIGLIKDRHQAGYKYAWTVTEPDVRAHCDWAWIAYVNRGSIAEPSSDTKPVTWLESAVLRHEAGRWRIVFFHSTRAPAAP